MSYFWETHTHMLSHGSLGSLTRCLGFLSYFWESIAFLLAFLSLFLSSLMLFFWDAHTHPVSRLAWLSQAAGRLSFVFLTRHCSPQGLSGSLSLALSLSFVLDVAILGYAQPCCLTAFLALSSCVHSLFRISRTAPRAFRLSWLSLSRP